jgi:predicted metal-dependent peptidase
MANISSEYKNIFEKIRIEFLFENPFLSFLALNIPLIQKNNKYEVFETDGEKIYFDEKKASYYDKETLKYLYAHVLFHILLKHPFRMKERNKDIWNRSCDIVINLLMSEFKNMGKRDENEILLEKFRNKSVEEVYNSLYNESFGGGKNDENLKNQKRDLIENPKGTKTNIEELQTVITTALSMAKKEGNIPSSFLKTIDEIIYPKSDFKSVLYNYLTKSFFEKKSDFSRPNRRFIHQGLYIPGYVSEQKRISCYIALDRSMSINETVFKNFLGIIDEVFSFSNDFEITIIPFDEKVNENEIIKYEMGIKPEISFKKGDGGTVFDNVIKYLNKNITTDTFLIVLSDGFFSINKPLYIKTLFLISDKQNINKLKKYGDVIHFSI